MNCGASDLLTVHTTGDLFGQLHQTDSQDIHLTAVFCEICSFQISSKQKPFRCFCMVTRHRLFLRQW